MAQRLPKNLERHLIAIAPHSCEPEYLADRLEAAGPEKRWAEVGLLDGLQRHGMINLMGGTVRLSAAVERGGSRYEVSVKAREGFILTAEAEQYLDDLPIKKARKVGRVVFDAVMLMGAAAAVAAFVISVASL